MKPTLVALLSVGFLLSACGETGAKTYIDETMVKATFVLEYEGNEITVTANYNCTRRFKLNDEGRPYWQNLDWDGDVIDQTLPDGSIIRIENEDGKYACPPHWGKNLDVGFNSVKVTMLEKDKTVGHSVKGFDIEFEWADKYRPIPVWLETAGPRNFRLLWSDSQANPSTIERYYSSGRKSNTIGARVYFKSIEFRRVRDQTKPAEFNRKPEFDFLADMVGIICRRNDMLGARVVSYDRSSWGHIVPLADVLTTITEPSIVHPDTWPAVMPLYDLTFEDPEGVWLKSWRGKTGLRLKNRKNVFVGFAKDRVWDLSDLTSYARFFKMAYAQDYEERCTALESEALVAVDIAPTVVRLGSLLFDLKNYRAELGASDYGLWIYNPQTEELISLGGPRPKVSFYR